MEDRILELYNKKYSIPEMAEKLGVSKDKISKYIKENNLDPRFCQRIEEYIIEEICYFLDKGYSKQEIVNLLDVSIWTVLDITDKDRHNLEEYKLANVINRRKEKIIDDYVNGLEVEEIAKKYNLKEYTVNNVLREFKKKMNEERDKLIVTKFLAGEKITNVANELKVSYRHAKHVLQKFDLYPQD